MAKKVDLQIVVSGTQVTLDVNINQPLKSLIEKALKEAGEASDPKQWGFYVEENGQMVSIGCDLKVEELLTRVDVVYLNKNAGAAGW